MSTLPPNPSPPLPDDDLPAALRRDLLELHALAETRRAIPPDLDAEILAAAHAKLRPAEQPRRLLLAQLRYAGPVAAAAALVLVAYVSVYLASPVSPAGGPRLPLAGRPVAIGELKSESAADPLSSGSGGLSHPSRALDVAAQDPSAAPTSTLPSPPMAPAGALAAGRAQHDAKNDAAGANLREAEANAELAIARLPGDLTGDGVVDILDALALARAIRDDAVTPAMTALADLNHDGVLDRDDIDAIARSAVSLAAHTPAPAKPAGPPSPSGPAAGGGT